MSKYDSLLKKTQVFEKIAVYGSRKDFLQSLAQNLSSGATAFPDENISAAMGAVAGAASNLSRSLENSGQASSYESELTNKISGLLDNAKVSSYVNDRAELSAKADPIRALLANAIAMANRVLAPNFANADDGAKQAAEQLKNEANKATTLINNFYRSHGINIGDTDTSAPQAQVAGPAPQAPAAKQTSVAEAAKNLAKALESRVDKLTTGPQRAAQLKELEVGVKALQNYFRNLQKSGGLQGYFARMEIVSALQKIYSALEYADLDVVQSLNAGKGVPETPDSKI